MAVIFTQWRGLTACVHIMTRFGFHRNYTEYRLFTCLTHVSSFVIFLAMFFSVEPVFMNRGWKKNFLLPVLAGGFISSSSSTLSSVGTGECVVAYFAIKYVLIFWCIDSKALFWSLMPNRFVNFVTNKDLGIYGRNGTNVVDGDGIFGLSSSSALIRSTPSVVDILGSFRENKTGGSWR